MTIYFLSLICCLEFFYVICNKRYDYKFALSDLNDKNTSQYLYIFISWRLSPRQRFSDFSQLLRVIKMIPKSLEYGAYGNGIHTWKLLYLYCVDFWPTLGLRANTIFLVTLNFISCKKESNVVFFQYNFSALPL